MTTDKQDTGEVKRIGDIDIKLPTEDDYRSGRVVPGIPGALKQIAENHEQTKENNMTQDRIDSIHRLSLEIDEIVKQHEEVGWQELTVVNKNESGIVMSEQSGMVIADKESVARLHQSLRHVVAALQQVRDLL